MFLSMTNKRAEIRNQVADRIDRKYLKWLASESRKKSYHMQTYRKMLLPCSVLTDVLANNGFYKVGSTQQHIFLNNQVQGIEVYSSKHRVLAQVLFWMKRNLNFFLKQLLSI